MTFINYKIGGDNGSLFIVGVISLFLLISAAEVSLVVEECSRRCHHKEAFFSATKQRSTLSLHTAITRQGAIRLGICLIIRPNSTSKEES
ncbi:MAG: hypothetical protein ACRD5J_06390 [Nitrososphaeraceae archaeon]